MNSPPNLAGCRFQTEIPKFVRTCDVTDQDKCGADIPVCRLARLHSRRQDCLHLFGPGPLPIAFLKSVDEEIRSSEETCARASAAPPSGRHDHDSPFLFIGVSGHIAESEKRIPSMVPLVDTMVRHGSISSCGNRSFPSRERGQKSPLAR